MRYISRIVAREWLIFLGCIAVVTIIALLVMVVIPLFYDGFSFQENAGIPQRQMTREEFAQQIKSKYPVYADIPDSELADRVLEKYPEYRSRILMPDPVKLLPPGYVLDEPDPISLLPPGSVLLDEPAYTGPGDIRRGPSTGSLLPPGFELDPPKTLPADFFDQRAPSSSLHTQNLFGAILIGFSGGLGLYVIVLFVRSILWSIRILKAK